MKKELEENVFHPIVRMSVPVPCRVIDQKVETVQGKSETVAKLFQDYVLGRLDPSQIGGSPVYDPEGSEEVDPFNHFGVELEDVTKIQDRGNAAIEELRKAKQKKPAPKPATPAQTPDDVPKDEPKNQ